MDLRSESDIEQLRRVAIAQQIQIEQLLGMLRAKCNELAVLKGIKNGGWATVTTSVGEIEARALVSGRMRPLRLGRGQRVHQIGIPYNYGTLGYTSGDVAGDLVPIAMDPNVSIHEAKTITCTIRPGRRAAYTTDVVDQPVPAEQHTTAGQSTAHGIDRGR